MKRLDSTMKCMNQTPHFSTPIHLLDVHSAANAKANS